MDQDVSSQLIKQAPPGDGRPASAGSAAVGVQMAIHPQDEMYLFTLQKLQNARLGRQQYARQGLRIATTFERIADWCFPAASSTPTLLDFASGHGRATRFLAAHCGADRVWVSDIKEDAVAFCRSNFGVRGFVSTTVPEELKIEERFDLIFVSSLFSHLPRHLFHGWLLTLTRLLETGGVLAFSVHDSEMVNASLMPADGYLFVPQSESRVLNADLYGTSYAANEFVVDAIRKAFGADVFIRCLPKGLCRAQHLYIASRDPTRRVESIPPGADLVGYVDTCALAQGGQLQVTGWAACHDPADPVEWVTLEIDGVPIAQSATQSLRPDVAAAFANPAFARSGFDVRLGIHEPFSDKRLLQVTAQTLRGARDVLFVSQLSELTAG